MLKIAESEMEVLAQAPAVIRTLVEQRDKLASQNDKLAAENAAYRRRDECEKVARQMHGKGIEAEVPFDTLVDRLEKAAEQGHLPEIERSVEWFAPDMGSKLAQLSQDDKPTTSGGSDFERFITNGA